jgi:hypothetical protein
VLAETAAARPSQAGPQPKKKVEVVVRGELHAGRKCFGCGCRIVIEVPGGGDIGTAPRAKVHFQKRQKAQIRDERNAVLCARCMALKKGEVGLVSRTSLDALDADVFNQQIDRIQAAMTGLVVLVVDAMDVEGSLLRSIRNLIGKHPIVVVVARCDLLPVDIDKYHRHLNYFIRGRVKAKRIVVTEVLFVSAKTGYGIPELSDYVRENYLGRNVYCVGAANIGKSTLVNSLVQYLAQWLRKEGGRREKLHALAATVSSMPGTTLSCCRFPCFRTQKAALWDTPGLFAKRSTTWLPEDRRDRRMRTPRRMRPQRLSFPRELFKGKMRSVFVQVGAGLCELEVLVPPLEAARPLSLWGFWLCDWGETAESCSPARSKTNRIKSRGRGVVLSGSGKGDSDDRNGSGGWFDLLDPNGGSGPAKVLARADGRWEYSGDVCVLELGFFALKSNYPIAVRLWADRGTGATALLRPNMIPVHGLADMHREGVPIEENGEDEEGAGSVITGPLFLREEEAAGEVHLSDFEFDDEHENDENPVQIEGGGGDDFYD